MRSIETVSTGADSPLRRLGMTISIVTFALPKHWPIEEAVTNRTRTEGRFAGKKWTFAIR